MIDNKHIECKFQINRLSELNKELHDKLHRRNVQIADLKQQVKAWETKCKECCGI